MIKAHYWKYILIRHFVKYKKKKVCFKGLRWKLNKIQRFLIIIYNKNTTAYHINALWYKGKTNGWPMFWTTVLFKSNVNTFHSPVITEQWLEHHEKLFKWTQNNWSLFIFLRGSMKITHSQLQVRNCLCTKVKYLP